MARPFVREWLGTAFFESTGIGLIVVSDRCQSTESLRRYRGTTRYALSKSDDLLDRKETRLGWAGNGAFVLALQTRFRVLVSRFWSSGFCLLPSEFDLERSPGAYSVHTNTICCTRLKSSSYARF